ncbi:MAG TPA: four helix bundle protein [Bacteroidia bacterium]|nr:four helix bundle protein [Bacteroidia bacterium]
MEKARRFEDLIVWQKAHSFVLEVYLISKSFPREEIYGLTSQLRRASVSVPSNIAEGFKRSGAMDKIKFYNIARASLEEAKYLLILSKDLKYGGTHLLISVAEEISRLLNALIKSIKKV